MYKKSLDVAFDLFDEVTVEGNFFKHPKPSKMSDLEVIAVALAAESASNMRMHNGSVCSLCVLSATLLQ
jgi:hypothetical protein